MKERFDEEYRFQTDFEVMNMAYMDKQFRPKMQNDDLTYSLFQENMETIDPSLQA